MSALPGNDALPLLHRAPDFLDRLPILVLSIHSRCNCRCVMCDIWRRDLHAELRVAALERHRESLRRLHVERVVLSGGEPLLHSDLQSLCRFFLDLGIRLTLLTTGVLLERRAPEVTELFDDVIVSLDGPPAVHDQVRRVTGAFSALERGVTAVRALRPKMAISARCTVQKLNFRHLDATVDAAKRVGFDSVSFLAADLTSEAFNRPHRWTAERQDEVALTEAEVAEFSALMEKLICSRAEEIATGCIAESAAKLRRIVAHFRAHVGGETEQAPRCNAPWVSAVIETDGSVRPCFFHPPIAHMGDAPLDEAINSPEALAFRERLDIATDPVCRRCVCSLWFHR